MSQLKHIQKNPATGRDHLPIWAPLAPTTYQVAPNAVTSCPFTSPGALSWTKRYSGLPPYVTCMVPSARVIVPARLAVSPAPATGVPRVVTGGHAVAQAPEQFETPLVSFLNR